ncbi:Endonuclease V [Orchesella cincta]|uniref:Endonuclease V n=1 Tax=Orchesella cincta TaxID=48709 RepID=A0A1D2M823_ORCCI|nr:Endonuclease V [Orchesella cincta]
MRHKIMADDPASKTPRYPAVSPALIERWDLLQNELSKKIIHSDTEDWQLTEELHGLKRVAGVDVSYPSKDHDSYECDAYAAVVICEFPTMKIIHKEVQQVHLPVPYAPGYLAFRESEPVVNLLNKIMKEHPSKVPDVLLVDGNGMLHPNRTGLACHVGITTEIPTIGVAKNLHMIDGIGVTRQMLQGMAAMGDYVLIRDNANEILGMALKTAKDTKNPMYISIGHKISLETAKNVVLKCCKYKIPEPIRFADNISREFVRKMEEKSQSQKT